MTQTPVPAQHILPGTIEDRFVGGDIEVGHEGHTESAKWGSSGKTAFQVDRTVCAGGRRGA